MDAQKRYQANIAVGVTSASVARLLGLLTAALGAPVFGPLLHPPQKKLS